MLMIPPWHLPYDRRPVDQDKFITPFSRINIGSGRWTVLAGLICEIRFARFVSQATGQMDKAGNKMMKNGRPRVELERQKELEYISTCHVE
jgi:hypothetical protein